MSNILASRNWAATLSLLTIGAALSIGVANAVAGDDISEDQIVRALAPTRPLTRSLSAGAQAEPAATAAADHFVQTIRNRATRSLSLDERDKIATIAKARPNIDLEIDFEFNSADISAKSLPTAQALGRALTNPDLKGSTFIVAGYTDAVGGEAYNQDLSERRADAIKRYLTDTFSIPGPDLVTVGYGKTKLKDPGNPLSEVNRRVQVVNMADKTTASN
jgi:outer membrane protein OmpA-like peptidoglycan-associated protein